MSDPLVRVKRAANAKRRAEQEYRQALAAAVEALEETNARDAYAKVAQVAGVSRQAVRQLVGRVV